MDSRGPVRLVRHEKLGRLLQAGQYRQGAHTHLDTGLVGIWGDLRLVHQRAWAGGPMDPRVVSRFRGDEVGQGGRGGVVAGRDACVAGDSAVRGGEQFVGEHQAVAGGEAEEEDGDGVM